MVIPAHTHQMSDIPEADDGLGEDWLKKADAEALANEKVNIVTLPITTTTDTDPDGDNWAYEGYNIFVDSGRATDIAFGIFQGLQEAIDWLCTVNKPTYHPVILTLAEGTHEQPSQVIVRNHPTLLGLIIVGDAVDASPNRANHAITFPAVALPAVGIRVESDDVKLQGFELDGTNTNGTTSNGIEIARAVRGQSIEGVTVTDFEGAGIFYESGCVARLEDSTVINIPNNYGILAEQCTLRLMDSRVDNCAPAGMRAYGGASILVMTDDGPGAVNGTFEVFNNPLGLDLDDCTFTAWCQMRFSGNNVACLFFGEFAEVRLAEFIRLTVQPFSNAVADALYTALEAKPGRLSAPTEV